jgi:hypothetical protein
VAVSVHKAHIEPMGGIDPTLILWRIMTYAAKKTSRFLSSDPRGRYDVAQWLAWQLAGQGSGTRPNERKASRCPRTSGDERRFSAATAGPTSPFCPRRPTSRCSTWATTGFSTLLKPRRGVGLRAQ